MDENEDNNTSDCQSDEHISFSSTSLLAVFSLRNKELLSLLGKRHEGCSLQKVVTIVRVPFESLSGQADRLSFCLRSLLYTFS